MVAGDHIEGFFLSGVPALAVYVRPECSGTFGHYRYTFPIHEPLARHLVPDSHAGGDLTLAPGHFGRGRSPLRVDHSFSRRRKVPSSPCGRRITVRMKTTPTGIR